MKRGLFLLIGILWSPALWAQYPVFDPARGIQLWLEQENILEQAIQQTNKVKELEQQLKIITDNTANPKKVSSTAFDLVRREMLQKKVSDLSEIIDTDETENLEKARAFILKTFFAETNATDGLVAAAEIQRRAYLEELAAPLIVQGVAVQKALEEDAKSADEAPHGGSGFLQDIHVNTQAVQSAAKMAVVNIALQIRMIELEAASNLFSRPARLLKEPPASEGGTP